MPAVAHLVGNLDRCVVFALLNVLVDQATLYPFCIVTAASLAEFFHCHVQTMRGGLEAVHGILALHVSHELPQQTEHLQFMLRVSPTRMIARLQRPKFTC